MTYFPQSGTAPFDFDATHWLVVKKPVQVEAIRFTGYNTPQIRRWIGPEKSWVVTGIAQPGEEPFDGKADTLSIETLEGLMTARAGDWIIKGVKGEFYPCKPDIFEQTYEPVRELDAV